jgi:hypothetical protein
MCNGPLPMAYQENQVTKITQDAMDYGPWTMDFSFIFAQKLFTEN